MEEKEINKEEAENEKISMTDEQLREFVNVLTVRAYDSADNLYRNIDDDEAREYCKSDIDSVKKALLDYDLARKYAEAKGKRALRMLQHKDIPCVILVNELRLAAEALLAISAEKVKESLEKQRKMAEEDKQ